jgi:DNA-directed RNA polymerase specialized sigma24 family protein
MSSQAALAWAMECDSVDKHRELVREKNRLESRIHNNLLKRYRQEWSFAHHCCRAVDTVKPAEPKALDETPDLMLSGLKNALAALSEPERRLIEMLYWQQRNESQVAAEMGVSQPAINKRKRLILSKLSNIINNHLSEGRL